MTDTFPNWFRQGGAEVSFARHLQHLRGRPVRVLQIGVYTGDASCWLLDNVLTDPDARLVDVDTWLGSDEPEHVALDWPDIERFYMERIEAREVHPLRRVWVYRCPSADFWRTNQTTFDFVYVDGDHHAVAVLRDGLAAIDALTPGGIVAFDDYQWGLGLPVSDRPRAAIDFIVESHPHLEVLEMDLQVWLRRPV